jgi:hypothetical protein
MDEHLVVGRPGVANGELADLGGVAGGHEQAGSIGCAGGRKAENRRVSRRDRARSS